jgi:hypothetical protein
MRAGCCFATIRTNPCSCGSFDSAQADGSVAERCRRSWLAVIASILRPLRSTPGPQNDGLGEVGCGVDGEWGGLGCRFFFAGGFVCRFDRRFRPLGLILFLFGFGEVVAFSAAAVGVVRVVGFAADALVAVAVLFVAFCIFFFKDGFGFCDLLVLACQDHTAHRAWRRKDAGIAGKIGGRDLDAVEEESGMARVERSGCEGGEDPANRDLDGEMVLNRR